MAEEAFNIVVFTFQWHLFLNQDFCLPRQGTISVATVVDSLGRVDHAVL